MSGLDDPTKEAEEVATPHPTAPPLGEAENQGPGTAVGATVIVRRWRREDLLKRWSLALRGLGLLFSLISLVIMASNQHGDWKNFNKYEEYRYVLAIAILSILYTGAQILRLILQNFAGKQLFPRRSLGYVDFFGDQIVAYFLVSAASSAIPLTNSFRERENNIFTGFSAVSIGSELLAFLALALSSLVSGYQLSNQSYI